MDESKLSPALGTRHALPVEVARFGWKSQERFLASPRRASRDCGSARDGKAYETDQGNWILDCAFGPIADPASLEARLADGPGIVEHGLFCGIATEVIVAGETGIPGAAPERLTPRPGAPATTLKLYRAAIR